MFWDKDPVCALEIRFVLKAEGESKRGVKSLFKLLPIALVCV